MLWRDWDSNPKISWTAKSSTLWQTWPENPSFPMIFPANETSIPGSQFHGGLWVSCTLEELGLPAQNVFGLWRTVCHGAMAYGKWSTVGASQQGREEDSQPSSQHNPTRNKHPKPTLNKPWAIWNVETKSHWILNQLFLLGSFRAYLGLVKSLFRVYLKLVYGVVWGWFRVYSELIWRFLVFL